MPRRVVHHNWVYRTLRAGLWDEIDVTTERQGRIREAVRQELGKLPDFEREFIDLYWFQGRPTSEIARLLGKKQYKLEGLKRRILRKLKNRLTGFVREEFRLSDDKRGKCPICSHSELGKINNELRAKKPHETWRRLIRLLKIDYGVDIKTPQVIIGHLKYHIREET
jgi:hypothetical protein